MTLFHRHPGNTKTPAKKDRASAHRMLDAVKRGVDYSDAAIAWALRATGDVKRLGVGEAPNV